MIPQLLKAGLTANEGKIYEVLLKDKSLSVSQISKKTGIHRRNAYDACYRLMEKGLINETLINNKHVYQSVHPSHLSKLLQEQHSEIDSIMPNLLSLYEQTQHTQFVKVFSGKKGIKASFTEGLVHMKKGDSFFLIGGVDMGKILGAFIEQHHDDRILKNIKTNSLFNNQYKKRAKLLLAKGHNARVLPKGIYLPVQTYIYGSDMVCHVLLGEQPFVIQILHKEFADHYRAYFDALWSISKEAN